MTSCILTMPRLGETMDEGTIVAWLVKPGEPFQRGAPILEVETDKTVVEYPALGDGVLEEAFAAPGDRVGVGAPIARVTVTGAGEWDDISDAAEAPVEITEAPAPIMAARPAAETDRIRATPVARRLARAAGLALDRVSGTGRRGRIERHDVEALAGDGSRLVAPAAQRDAGIAYETVGAGAATYLLLHGFGGDRTAWAATASGLARGGARAVIVDLPGHGETEREAATLADLATAMTGFAATLDGPLHLVGHSLGAAVAVEVARALGGRAASLTLIAPAGAGREINRDFIHGMAEATTAAELAHLLDFLGPKGNGLSDAALERMAALAARGRLKALAEAVAGPGGQRIDILRPLAALPDALPVRALIGTEDRVIPPHHAFNMPARVAVHFVRAGHMPQWDAPGETLGLLAEARNRH
jgi:pyruvate dehydrogenase E2 component (dihydrolipoamide acetyltransferase)